MQASIRQYAGKGAREIFDLLEKNTADVQSRMEKVKGFVSYTLARSSGGGFAVTVCDDQAGLDESATIAKQWIAENGPNLGAAAPTVITGKVIIHLK